MVIKWVQYKFINYHSKLQIHVSIPTQVTTYAHTASNDMKGLVLATYRELWDFLNRLILLSN